MEKPSGPLVFTVYRGIPHATGIVMLAGALAALLIVAVII